MQDALGLVAEQFVPIEEVALLALVAEEQPVAARGVEVLALFEECAERRDARAGTDHDDVARQVGGQAELR